MRLRGDRKKKTARWSSPRLASSPRADDNARVLAAMASKARARARSVGIGVESSLTVAIDSKNHGGGVAEVSPLEGSPLRTKKDDDDALVAALRGLLKRLTPSGYVDRHSSSRASIKASPAQRDRRAALEGGALRGGEDPGAVARRRGSFERS
jgi:hypothetical protein